MLLLCAECGTSSIAAAEKATFAVNGGFPYFPGQTYKSEHSCSLSLPFAAEHRLLFY